MALTNDQITAQNFKDFYGQIRPYLNGNVPTFANTFNKSDLYSTDEQLVGRWIDGKPVYQKTYVTDPFTVTTSNQYIVLENDFSNKKIIAYSGFLDWGEDTVERAIPFPNVVGTNNWIDVQVQVNAVSGVPKLQLLHWRASGSTPNTVARVTIQYIKINDTSMSISDGNEYSTDEQVVGHWVNNKPIYQKTIFLGALPNADEKQVNSGIINLDIIIDFAGFSYATDSSTVRRPLPYVYSGSAGINLQNGIWVQKDNGTWNVHCICQNNRSNESAYVTLRYTKTTD